MKLLRINQVSEQTGLHVSTLRRLHKSGKLVPQKISDGGTRYYSQEQINKYMNVTNNRTIIGYCRVSSKKQEDDLKRQIEKVTTYMLAKGYQFEIITDVGSGVNYNKKGLQQLISKIENNEVEKIVVLFKDRLVRFGMELIETICKINNTTIEIIDNTQKSEEKEIITDLVQIITEFSCKLQERKSKISKQLIDELKL